MKVKCIGAVALVLCLSGCFAPRHPDMGQLAGGTVGQSIASRSLTICPKGNPCEQIANRRQYYDEREARYYYFDRNLGRYYWENGDARF
jgi:hypothetical protein